MDLRKLKTLIDLVSESNISELEITEADGKVRIVKADPAAAAVPPLTMRTLPSASVISSSEILDSDTRSISVLSLRRSMELHRRQRADYLN